MMNQAVSLGILILVLVLLGDSYPKIALAIAGLILFGAILFNADKYKTLLTQSEPTQPKHGGAGAKF